MSLYEMSTLATGLLGLRSTFRAAFAGLNQYMIRELKQALIVTQIAKSCLKLTTFSCPSYCWLHIIYVYFATQFIFYLRRGGEEGGGEGEGEGEGERGAMPLFVLSYEEECIFV